MKELSGIVGKYNFALFLNNSIVINSFSMKLPDTLVILVDLNHVHSVYLQLIPCQYYAMEEFFTIFCPILLILSQIAVIIILYYSLVKGFPRQQLREYQDAKIEEKTLKLTELKWGFYTMCCLIYIFFVLYDAYTYPPPPPTHPTPKKELIRQLFFHRFQLIVSI